nr:hypothetical protein [Anaerolineae bacterium]
MTVFFRHRVRRGLRALLLSLCALSVLSSSATPALADAATPDPRFGVVEAFVNSAAATEAGAGYSRIILRWDVI